MLALSLTVRSQCNCYLSLQWSYQISAACYALRHFYILFLTTIGSKRKLAQCVGFLYLKAGGWEFNLRWERATMPIFFLFSTPTCSFFLYLIIFHQDAYKCFPFIIFLNNNAPIIIIRKPTLFLCSFNNNDNKYFVGYF